MIATLVHVWVKEAFLNDFIRATKENHLQSVEEKGNIRFDITQDASDPLKFVLYEAYISEEAAAEHKTTDHYKKWRETVQDMMVQPRKGEKHNILFPENF